MTVQFGDYRKYSNDATLAGPIAIDTKALLKGYKNIFAWNYTDLKKIPP
jgi:hypothetical protein